MERGRKGRREGGREEDRVGVNGLITA